MNQKAFKVGDSVTWICPISKKRYTDTIQYIGQNSIEGINFDLSYLYYKKRLQKVE